MNDYDFEILKHIFDSKNTTYKDVCVFFPEKKYNTKSRIMYLRSEKYLEVIMALNKDSDKADDYVRVYSISEKGKKFLQDTQLEQKQKRKEKTETWILEIMRSFLFPLIVALITAYITAYITARYFR
jgi:hypothetical protein